MVVEMDDAIGALAHQLTASGIWNSTLLLTTTDNGGMTRFQVRRACTLCAASAVPLLILCLLSSFGPLIDTRSNA